MLQSRPPGSPNPQRFPHRPQGYLDADEKRATAVRGDLRKHHSDKVKINNAEWKLLGVVTLIAIGVRLFRLSQPNSVVFDEVHFGKFASKYIKTQYFVDVHPPLAKLLFTLVAFIRGFDGSFDFKEIGLIYPDNVPYTSMRFFPALLGVGVVPLAYLTLRELRCGVTTALVGSSFVLFENGHITQSRYILLDSPLVFFTALTVFFWVSFANLDHNRAFTEEWWLRLFLVGLSLGAVVSVKWVGLFTIATVGVATLLQLWYLLGDLRVTPRMFAKHFLARALCLIAVPIIFYMLMFAIHFQILQSSGDGDGFMSAPFQHTLSGRGMSDTYADVAFGSLVTLRHINTQGGYLHSHDHVYPAGSHQQQITLYPHRDENNEWQITHSLVEGQPDHDYETEPTEFIKNGDVVRFEHVITKKRLHSHSLRPPVSDVDFQNEVSGYGFPGFPGDVNDNWVVEIEHGDKMDRESETRLRSLHTTFRLRHVLTGCYLFSHKVRLPEWGFDQQEVTCNTNAVKPNSLWYIETSTHTQFGPENEETNYHLPGFFAKFWELQRVMWTTNAGLTDKHVYDSRPYSWPFLRRGINFWVKDHRHIYLMGNPFVWWLGTLSVAVYALARIVLILRHKRGYQDFTNSRINKYDSLCGFFAIGWALHYFPFYLMQRQLFLHHYFPAMYFTILLTSTLFDFFTTTLRPRVRLQVGVVLILLAIYTFSRLSPLIYGNIWTKGQCDTAKWVKTWDFSCVEYYDDYSKYQNVAQITPTPDGIPVATIGGDDGRAPVIVDDPAGNDKARVGVPAHNPVQTTEGIQAGAVPGPNVFEQKVAKQIRSDVESKPGQTPLRPLSSSTGESVSAMAAADEDAHVPLPPIPEDLATPEDEELVQSTTTALDLKPDAYPPKESTGVDSKKLSENIPKEEDKIVKGVDEVGEDLERVQKELFADA